MKQPPIYWGLVTCLTLFSVLALGACSDQSSPSQSNANPNGTTSAFTADSLVRSGSANLSSSTSQKGLWVDGIGSVTAAPDIAILAFAIEARTESVREARSQAAANMATVMTSLSNNGIKQRDIQTTSFQIQPITIYRELSRGNSKERIPVITGYKVTNSASAKIRDLAIVGQVIDGATEAGGDQIRINSIVVTLENPKLLEAQARTLALEDAKQKANQIAAVTGVTLGAPMFITESSHNPIIARSELAVARASAIDIETPISGGERHVTINVRLAFQIL